LEKRITVLEYQTKALREQITDLNEPPIFVSEMQMDWGHIEEHFHPKHCMPTLKDGRARGKRPIEDQLASNWSLFDLQLVFN